MALMQSVEGCLTAAIGEYGLTDALMNAWLGKLEPGIAKLRRGYETGGLPLLRIPGRSDDIETARAAYERLCEGAGTLVFFGTGGSSLGGQALAQLGGWFIPGEKPSRKFLGPRLRVYDNLDGRTLAISLAGLDLETTRFVVISKSGNTPETLVQLLAALQMVEAKGLKEKAPKLFLGLTEPARPGHANGLRAVCGHYGIPMLDHEPEIGGRFSVLTNVGLLPAFARGLDVRALRAGAGEVVRHLVEAKDASSFAPAVGAAAMIALAKERNVRVSVLLAYNDRLVRFSHWYVQLWAESLGKSGEGTTPVAALGPVDQHSQLQLWLDGPREHVVTVLRTDSMGLGPCVTPALAALAGADYLGGRTAGDVVAAQQQAIPEAMTRAGRPVRTIDLGSLDEHTLGGLMMHFMVETILAGHLLGIDPFDQPAVEAGKILTRDILSGWAKEDTGGRSRAATRRR